MATFEALRLIRQRRAEAPGIEVSAMVEMIGHVRADGANHDFDAAFELDKLVVSENDSLQTLDFYRLCIEACIFAHRPLWVRTIPFGRKTFVQKLGRDEAQCFEASGLMDDPPTDSIIEWWDSIAGRTRSATDMEKMKQARAAEKLSLEYERTRLLKLGIEREPVWMSIDDNWAGYDILSSDIGPQGVTARMIEVKSTTASPLKFFVSRNEWKVCLDVGDAYQFHIWDMRNQRLYLRSGREIADHIPENRGNGRWSNTEIPLGSS